jgi:glycosyltransferase involved in cell wall biosynthesis
VNKLKLIKFDIIHPPDYLNRLKSEWKDLKDLSLEEYRERLIKLRSNYSDFYTHHLNTTGDWAAEEYFLMDDDFTDKVAKKLWGSKALWKQISKGQNLPGYNFHKSRWRKYVITAYIRHVNPDVIFVRSQPIESIFWNWHFQLDALLVSRLSARLPFNWHPNHWHLIYTDQPDFKTFFDLHGVKTILNKQGFDERIASELKDREKKYDVIFIGGLGTENFSKRTNMLNSIADKVELKWWGYWWHTDRKKLADFPKLEKRFNGSVSGMEMFQIYKDSKIVINDYVDTANGIGFNQRMFELMGCGVFMLTREAPNFEGNFPKGIFATFKDEEDLLAKVEYYLAHEDEREAIATKGQAFVLENYNYKDIVGQFGEDLKAELGKHEFRTLKR